MDEKTISRIEFEHFLAEYEGFRDTITDEITKLVQAIEILRDDLEELKNNIRTHETPIKGQVKLV